MLFSRRCHLVSQVYFDPAFSFSGQMGCIIHVFFRLSPLSISLRQFIAIHRLKSIHFIVASSHTIRVG